MPQMISFSINSVLSQGNEWNARLRAFEFTLVLYILSLLQAADSTGSHRLAAAVLPLNGHIATFRCGRSLMTCNYGQWMHRAINGVSLLGR